jgi:hypothetical protein
LVMVLKQWGLGLIEKNLLEEYLKGFSRAWKWRYSMKTTYSLLTSDTWKRNYSIFRACHSPNFLKIFVSFLVHQLQNAVTSQHVSTF